MGTTNTITLAVAFTKYRAQRNKAQQRGIGWEFTFETWCDWWKRTGLWRQRGRTGMVMARNQDIGPYAPDNVIAMYYRNNLSDSGGRSIPTLTPDGYFKSASAAARHYGIDNSTASWRARNRKSGWSYIDGRNV